MPNTVTVVEPGLSVVQDLGRVSASRVGQMSAGALDQYGASAANSLVGNPVGAALVEVTAFDFSAVTAVDRIIAVTGALADVTIDGLPQEQWEPVLWPRGHRLSIRRIRAGLRVYLALHGDVVSRMLLGSCAPDTVLGFGEQLAAGTTLSIEDDCPVPRLTDTCYTVGAASNHIGLRLAPSAGSPLPQRDRRSEVLSRGVPIGAVEVPEGNELLVLHRGRGVTAGYPVLAVVTRTGLSRLGQAAPGDQVRFHRVTVDVAVTAYRDQQRRLDQLRDRVRNVFAAHHMAAHFDRATQPPVTPTTQRFKESA